ncbi:MAG: hypothetical protein EXQ56_01645 [Acidobacteria bacterium]|nr:hypothetical protein [Acidobacteriota bacterium]
MLLSRSIVTLTTDFGTSDPYVGIMKGAILNVNPEAELVDITHDIRAYDVMEAAYAVAQAYSYFPPRTIHLIVVDPGVGTPRRPLLVTAGRYHFICPDNGVLSVVLAKEEGITVRAITSTHYYLEPVSNTFHGRDIFAPVAGWLSRRVETEKFGEPITDHVRYAPPTPKRLNEKLVKGVIIHVDRFGTLRTNLTPADVPEIFGLDPKPFKIVVGKCEVTQVRQAYAEGAQGEVFAIVGSAGFIEIASNRASAAQAVGTGKGTEVGVVLS